MRTSRRHRVTPYLFLLLPLVLVTFAELLPALYTTVLSFHAWNIISDPSFVGLENYKRLVTSDTLLRSLANTGVWVVGTLAFPVGLALVIAKILTIVEFGRPIYKAIFFVPATLSPTIAAIVWRRVLTTEQGALSALLPGEQASLLADPTLNTFVMLGVWTWQFLGLNLVLFLVGFEALPRAPIEAARIDGATGWQVFRLVELPLLRPIMLLVVGNAIINSARMFDIPWVMTAGGPGRASETLAISLYRESFLLFDMGLGAAIGVVISVLTLVFAVRAFRGRA